MSTLAASIIEQQNEIIQIDIIIAYRFPDCYDYSYITFITSMIFYRYNRFFVYGLLCPQWPANFVKRYFYLFLISSANRSFWPNPRRVHPVSNARIIVGFSFLPSRTPPVHDSLPFIRLAIPRLCVVLPSRNAHRCVRVVPRSGLGAFIIIFFFLSVFHFAFLTSSPRPKQTRPERPTQTKRVQSNSHYRRPCVSRLYAVCADSVQICNYTPS